jgi:Bacteriocin-protection, YdeI or OmpD-Associated/Domain of unknown function (DU1801)
MKIAPSRLAAVDAYIASAAPFAQPVLIHIREAMHEGAPGVTEAIKWSMPFFVYGGIILGNMSAFKAHCSFGLWGKETADALRSKGVLTDGAMGSFGRITSLEDLPSYKKMVSYIRKAAELIDKGERTRSLPARRRVAKAETPVPEALAAALKTNPAAGKRFLSFSPSCRREYCEWVADAKRPETRASRVATAIEWIAEGKSRNWKYEAKA